MVPWSRKSESFWHICSQGPAAPYSDFVSGKIALWGKFGEASSSKQPGHDLRRTRGTFTSTLSQSSLSINPNEVTLCLFFSFLSFGLALWDVGSLPPSAPNYKSTHRQKAQEETSLFLNHKHTRMLLFQKNTCKNNPIPFKGGVGGGFLEWPSGITFMLISICSWTEARVGCGLYATLCCIQAGLCWLSFLLCISLPFSKQWFRWTASVFCNRSHQIMR